MPRAPPLKAVSSYLRKKKKKIVGFYLGSGMQGTQRRIPELCSTNQVSIHTVGSRRKGEPPWRFLLSHLEEVFSFRYSERGSVIFDYRKGAHDYTKQLKSDFQNDCVLSYCGKKKKRQTGKSRKIENQNNDNHKKPPKLPSSRGQNSSHRNSEEGDSKFPGLGICYLFSYHI